MNQKHYKSRKESKHGRPSDLNPNEAPIPLFQKMIEMQCVENEIMELYHDTFETDPYDESEPYFTEEEHIERHATNLAFGLNWKMNIQLMIQST